jgi:N4-gp56 family major capsid protein
MALTQAANPPYLDLPNATDYHAGLSSDVKAKIWSELVKRDAREKNIFRDFKGEEGGGKPISTKRDLSAGGADNVTFTTTTPIRGLGVIGESQLKGTTDKLRFAGFNVSVDLIRHAVSYTQVLKLLRFTGKTLDQLSSELMSEWSARKEQDDCMVSLRNTALNQSADGAGVNVYNMNSKQFLGAGSGTSSLKTDSLDTDVLETSKQHLMSMGAVPMSVDSDLSGADIPQYLFFAPDTLARPLRSEPAYLEALRYSKERGNDNPQFKGSYPTWDNNMLHVHNIQVDTADGRQGSPLAPRAYLGVDGEGTALTFANTNTLGGGGAAYHASTLDYFANFTGFKWDFTTSDVSAAASSTVTNQLHYVTVYDLNSHSYCVYKYQAADITASQINGTQVAKVGTTAAEGSIIYQSNELGVPVQFALHMGANALYYATGAVENEPIFHYDDFATASNQAHLTATGIQTVRGLRPYQDSIGRLPNYMLVVGAAKIAGVNL